MLTVVVTVVRS